MRRFRRTDDRPAQLSYEVAAAHLEALVVMAGIDGAVRTGEYEELLALADELATPGTQTRLRALLRHLLDVPPVWVEAVAAVRSVRTPGAYSEQLVEGLRRVAAAGGGMFGAKAEFAGDVARLVGVAAPLSAFSDNRQVLGADTR